MRISWAGIMLLVLAAVGLWHLFSPGSKRGASVWSFLGQVAMVLGALMLMGLLIGGVVARWSYESRSGGQQAKIVAAHKSRLATAEKKLRKQPTADAPIPIEKLWDRINKPRIPIPATRAESVTEAEKVVVETSAAAIGKKATSTAAPEDTDTPEGHAGPKETNSPGGNATPEKGAGRDDPVDDHHKATASATPVVEETSAERSPGKESEKGQPLISTVQMNKNTAQAGERPDWVVHPPKRVGNTYRRVVVSGPFRTVDECHQELEKKLRQAVYQRMAAEGEGDPVYRGFTPAAYEDLGIGIDYIYREICRDEYVENLEASFGPMKQVYLLLEFDPPIEQHLRDVWRQYQVRERLGIIAFLSSVVLLLLGLVYGLLKLDMWTRGYYSKRLFLGVPAVILGLVLLLLVWQG